MKTESIPDALADALGRVVAREREAWRREWQAERARVRETMAELRQQVAEYKLELHGLQAADHNRVAERIASLKDGERGAQGDAGLNGKDGAPGERGEKGEPGLNGKDGAQGERGEKGDAGLNGKDGAQGERGEKGDAGLNGKDGAQGERGEKGDAGLNGKDGAPGERGAQGDAGLNGKDGAPGERGEKGEPGDRGEKGDTGERGAQGPAGKFAAPKEWARGVHYESALVTHEGATYCARRDTAEQPPHDDWALVAAKGKDAPVGEVCGLFDAARIYNKFDLVAFNGCEWRAKQDNPGPLPGDGWALSAKQGKRGDKGERGERGEKGVPGLPGASIVERKIEGFLLIDTMSDGTVHVCDIRPAFELYHGETR